MARATNEIGGPSIIKKVSQKTKSPRAGGARQERKALVRT